jgi:hypothetical protein
MRHLLLLAAAAALPLAGCHQPEGGTSVTINADDGNTLAAVDGTSGDVKFNIPGFAGQIKLPKIQLDASNFNLNGVHLYPGSTIDGVNVASGKDDDVTIAFTSPAPADQVRGWFEERLGKVGFTVAKDGDGLVGTTDDHKPFRLTLVNQGSGRAKGRIVPGSERATSSTASACPATLTLRQAFTSLFSAPNRKVARSSPI